MISVQVHKQKELIKIELKARKTLDGNILIFDHHDIDIVIMPEKNKVVTFAKNDFSEMIYEVQNRFFNFMKKKGIVTYDSIQGGNVYGSIEGIIAEAKDEHINALDYTIYNIYKFLKEEKPHYDYMEDYEQMLDDYYTEPTGEDSTELGEVPQSSEKGSIRPGYNYAPYWMSYMLEEGKEK
ncbi:MAG: hypothetical protein H8E32_02470 [Nitrospinae bacterium]|nr:hypothetical protein [Nitrospinota bacterium]